MTERSQLQFKITGMDCAKGVAFLKRAVGSVFGGCGLRKAGMDRAQYFAVG